MVDADLAARIGRLEDIEAIRRLKARYCYACDDGYDTDTLVDLFVEDAVWDGGDLGVAVGREKIRRFFDNTPAVMPFAVHMVMDPLIDVDGDRATGAWYLFQAATYAPDGTALWGSARYDEEYVRTAQGWKFQSLRLTSHFWTPFDAGWLEKRSIFEQPQEAE
ncbi:MAG: nuclear transport factor 2 family protein [Acidobacteriota bacterium]|nr:nuclear transport factor 2 family protein [Acidobacteriota bacterium]